MNQRNAVIFERALTMDEVFAVCKRRKRCVREERDVNLVNTQERVILQNLSLFFIQQKHI